MTYNIIRPFTLPLLWGAIIAIAVFPMAKWLQGKLGGRRGLAVTLLTLVFIISLVTPSYLLMESAYDAVILEAHQGGWETETESG